MPVAKSKGEAALDTALVEVFGPAAVTREMPVKIYGRTLFVDRVLRGYGLAFEVDGIQHDKFSPYHHKDGDGFANSQARDKAKQAWLEANGFTVIRFKHNETITADLLRKKVAAALKDQ